MSMTETLFRLSFSGYGLACALGAAVGLGVTLPRILRRGLGWAGFVRYAVCVLFFGWLCARLMYVIPDLAMGLLNENGIIKEHNSVYLNAIGSAVPALFFWEGGYALAGAIPGSVLGAWIAEKWTGSPKGFFRDQLGLALPVFILAERLAEWGTGLGTGTEVSARWLIGLGICPAEGGTAYHPLFLYEALLAFIVLHIMTVVYILSRSRECRGDLLRLFLVIFCLPLAALEAFRPLTGHLIIHFVNVTQVAAAVLALTVTVRWSLRLLRGRRAGKALRIVLPAVGWPLVLAAVALAVYCIFGMEKEWVSRTLAYWLIAASMAVIGAVTLLIGYFSREKGTQADGAQ